MKSKEDLIIAAKSKNREESYIDFKCSFDTKSNKDWCELLKDFTAFANSGGGIIVFGVEDDGTVNSFDLSEVKKLDPATITDKVNKYTGIQFSGFEILEIERETKIVIGILIDYAFPPLVFNKPGTYPDPNNSQKQKTAFKQGVLYFRHGAKSEPANSYDITKIVEIEINKRKNGWLENIKKVVEAPANFEITMMPASLKESKDGTLQIRLTDDENAPQYKLSFWEYYKYRRTELVEELSKIIKDRKIGVYDIQSVVSVYRITEKPEFATIPKGHAPRYSEEFLKWLAVRHKKDIDFFDDAREKYRKRIYNK